MGQHFANGNMKSDGQQEDEGHGVWIQISPLPPVHLFSLDASLVHMVELARGKYYLDEI